MADEPTQTEMSYDDDLAADVKSAMTEVSAKEPAAEPSPAPEPAPAEAAPAEPKATDGRPRDEQGRFTEKSAEEPKSAEAKSVPDAKIAAPIATPKAPDAAPIGPAPKGWSPRAVQEWHRLPNVVRDEILRSASMFGITGKLADYADRAKAQGQTLDQVLDSYVGIENLIRTDPMAGFQRVVQNLGFTQHQAGQLFAVLAQAYGHMPQPVYAGNGHAAYQPEPNAAAQAEQPDLSQLLAPVLSPYQQRLDQLEQRYIHQAEAERGQRLQSATSVIEKFRQDPANRYYDNVEAKVGDLLESGVIPRTGDFHADLSAAYKAACKLDDTVSEILEEERQAARQAEKDKAAREAADKARSASRSVTGSPSSGASNPAQKRDPRVSYDDDLHNDVVAAMRESMGRA